MPLVGAALEELQHAEERLGRAQAVDARHRGHDQHVAALEQRLGRAQPQPVDLLVDVGLFLDVGVGLRDVGLGLVVVVVGDEVLDRVVRERSCGTPGRAAPPASCCATGPASGGCTASTTLAMVKVLPEPVTPSSTCSLSPRSRPSTSWRSPPADRPAARTARRARKRSTRRVLVGAAGSTAAAAAAPGPAAAGAAGRRRLGPAGAGRPAAIPPSRSSAAVSSSNCSRESSPSGCCTAVISSRCSACSAAGSSWPPRSSPWPRRTPR